MDRIADVPGTASFEPGQPDAELAAKIGGPPMQKAESSRYVNDVEVGDPAGPTRDQALAEWRRTRFGSVRWSAGVILVEDDGRVWFYEPKNHFGGYQAALPKGRIDSTESEQQAALRELWEETGLTGEVTGIVGCYVGSTTITSFYRGQRTGGAPWESDPREVWSVKLARPEEAARLFAPHRQLVAALKDAGLLDKPSPATPVPH
jgi:8-oxo-dGTP pyrophosphatase MutT (NUDIX family)